VAKEYATGVSKTFDLLCLSLSAELTPALSERAKIFVFYSSSDVFLGVVMSFSFCHNYRACKAASIVLRLQIGYQ
jgi:hypothetical protein